jgi:hypothetical protein
MESAVDFSNSPAVGEKVVTVIGRHFGVSQQCVNVRSVDESQHVF